MADISVHVESAEGLFDQLEVYFRTMQHSMSSSKLLLSPLWLYSSRRCRFKCWMASSRKGSFSFFSSFLRIIHAQVRSFLPQKIVKSVYSSLHMPIAPSITCLSSIWHPNIDVQTGQVHFALLDVNWDPLLRLSTLIFSLQVLNLSFHLLSSCLFVESSSF